MIFYCSFILFPVISLLIISKLNKTKEQKNKIFFLTLFLFLFFFGAFRGSTVGTDTLVYLNLFNRIATNKTYFENSHFEIGYQYYNLLLSYISNSEQILLIVSSFIIVFGYLKIFKYESLCFPLTVYLFIISRNYFDSFNLLRQMIASVFLLIAYRKNISNNILSTFFYIFVACLFHTSAIIFIIIFPLKYLKMNFVILFALILILFLLIIPVNTLMRLSMYANYEGTKYDTTLKLGLFIDLFLVLFTLFLYFFISEKQKKDLFLVKLNIVFLVFQLFAFKSTIIYRINVYFTPFQLILLSNCLKNIKIFKTRLFITTITILMYSVLYFTIQIYRPDWNRIIPYSFFWQN